jgi:hypothetical protein
VEGADLLKVNINFASDLTGVSHYVRSGLNDFRLLEKDQRGNCAISSVDSNSETYPAVQRQMRDKNGQALVPLPGVEVIKVIVTLAERERKLYDDVSKESQKRVNDLLPRGVRPETVSPARSQLC